VSVQGDWTYNVNYLQPRCGGWGAQNFNHFFQTMSLKLSTQSINQLIDTSVLQYALRIDYHESELTRWPAGCAVRSKGKFWSEKSFVKFKLFQTWGTD